MKKAIRTAVKNSHIWLGLTAGLLFCIMGLSGSVLVYRTEIERALRPQWHAVRSAHPAEPLAEAARNLKARWPEAVIERATLPEKPGDLFILTARLQKRSVPTHVFSDAATGQVLGTFDVSWLDWLVGLHHNFRFGGGGRQFVGWIGVALLLVSLSGIVLWLWRGMLRDGTWRQVFQLNWSRTRTLTFQSHRLVGLVANTFLFVLSLTGIGLGFPATYRAAVESLTGQSTGRTVRMKDAPRESRPKQQPASLDRYVASALLAIPGGQVREVRINPRGPVSVRVWHEGDFRPEGSNQVSLDPITAAVINTDRATNWNSARRMVQAATSIHYAEWGGGVVKALWCLTGLAPTFLFVTGFLIWFAGFQAKRKLKHKLASFSKAEQSVLVH